MVAPVAVRLVHLGLVVREAKETTEAIKKEALAPVAEVVPALAGMQPVPTIYCGNGGDGIAIITDHPARMQAVAVVHIMAFPLWELAEPEVEVMGERMELLVQRHERTGRWRWRGRNNSSGHDMVELAAPVS